MNIRKYIDDYSRDIELVYNSKATKNNYISQVKCFLNYFENEIEPKAITHITVWIDVFCYLYKKKYGKLEKI